MLDTASPESVDRMRLKVRCAQLYYGLVPGLPGSLRQSDVARRLGVPRSQVVLWLKEVRERFLEVRLRVPRALTLELPLAVKLDPFGVREVRVVVDGNLSPEGGRRAVGAEAGRYLRSVLSAGVRVGLSGGRTLLEAVKELNRGDPLPRLSLYPLAAGGSLPVSANAMVAMLASSGGPGTDASGLWVPPLRPGRSRRELQTFLRRPEIRAVYRGAQRVDVALLGVGAVGGTEGIRGMREYLGASDSAARRMASSAARGFVLQQFIDREGRDYPCPLGERNLAVPLGAMRKLATNRSRGHGTVILVASGAAKAEAVAACVRGRLLNVLVIDTTIAEVISREFDP